MKLAIFCPHGARSGGPEALHQLAHVANEISPGSGYICYHDRTPESVTYEDFKKYNFLEIEREDINDEFVVVLPEVYPDFVEQFNQPVYYWWLSAVHCPPTKYSLLSNVSRHLAQSAYAAKHVETVFHKKSLMVSDYIHPDFYRKDNVEKKEQIVVNPAKREDLCNSFIQQNPDLQIIKLQNMPRSEVVNTLRESLVFVDFGEHPGKDRIPREALISGCLPIIRKMGAATLFEDVPIPETYLFQHLELASNIARQILNDYGNHVGNFNGYLQAIKDEYNIFYNQVKTFLDIVS